MGLLTQEWVWALSLAPMALTLLFWPPGEGETDSTGKEIPFTHGWQAFSKGHLDPQRGNMARLAPTLGSGDLRDSGARCTTFILGD